MVRKLAVAGAFGAFAFVLSGPLQHVGALPKTVIGDASNALIKAVLNKSVEPAWACVGGGSKGGPKGNNGFGNGGGDGVPGRSGFQDRTR